MIKMNKDNNDVSNDNNAASDITLTQHKYPSVFCGQMWLDPSISHHLAFPMLLKYMTEECPVDCGEPWMREHLEVVIHQGPHISARSSQGAA